MCEINYDETAYSMIENIFGDYREIVGKASDEIQKIARKHEIPAEIYKTENDEFISFSMTKNDFGNKELDKYQRYGEELYEKSKKEVSIYILGSPHVKLKVTKEIESTAPLLINLSIIEYSSAYDTLRHIKGLVENHKKLDSEDLNALKMIPYMGPPEDKRNLRVECLKLWKIIIKKGLIK